MRDLQAIVVMRARHGASEPPRRLSPNRACAMGRRGTISENEKMASILSGSSLSSCPSTVSEAYPGIAAAEEDNDLASCDFDEALRRLAAANEQLLQEIAEEQSRSHHDAETVHDERAPVEDLPGDEAEEASQLRLENVELRLRIQELELTSQSFSN